MSEQTVNPETVVDDDKPLIDVPKGKRAFYFFILYGLFTVDFIARVGVNAIFPILQADLGLTDTQIGSLASIVLFGMAALVLPVSYLGEKKSPKKTITILSAVWSLGSVLSGVASSFFLLASSRFLVGAGNSAYAPISNSMITSMYKKAQWGKMIGIYNTAMTFGGAAGALIFANLANSFGWRAAFFLVGGISFVFTILSLFLPETKAATDKASGGTAEGAKDKVNIKDAIAVTLKNKTLLGICFGAGVGIMALQGIGAYMTIYFTRICEMSIGTAAAIVGLAAILAAAGFPIGGAIMDAWYKRDKRCRVFFPALCFVLGGISYGLGFYFQNIVLILCGQVIYTFGGTGFHTATQELVPSWFKSVSYGVYVLFIQFMGALGPLCIGVISDAFGLVNALLAAQILFFVAAIILVAISGSYLKSYNAARKAEQDALNA